MEPAHLIMKAILILLAVVAVVVIIGWLHARQRRRLRAAVMAQPLNDEARSLLRKHMPLFDRVPDELRPKLEGLMQMFMTELSFEACGGLREVTEEMKLVISAQACLLLLESGYEDFGRLRSVLIYPDAYEARDHEEGSSVRLGESWQTGSVVLSWQSVVQGAANTEDGQNVVLHEFAHQLDQADGAADGLPKLKRAGDVRKWAEAFNQSYDLLCDRVNRGQKTVLDPYGATNPAEFFAVATETFFEKPRQLKEDHGAVYRELVRFYGIDPGEWK
jgi:Mlc titration factor MtfA (ptsG expression regulator)